MTYNSILGNNWKKASIYEIFLWAERNCHFSQVTFDHNLLMPIFTLQLTTARITPRFHRHSPRWQNQLKQLLPPQWHCFITGGAIPSSSSTDVAQHQAPSSCTTTSGEAAWEQGQGVGTGKRSLGWLFWQMQWQWCTNIEKHKPPWMR